MSPVVKLKNAAAAIALAALAALFGLSAAPSGAPITTAMAAETFPLEELLKPSRIEDKSLGSPDAKVTVIEYASLTCGHCGNFHRNTFAALKEKYVDTGKVRFIYRDFPLDPLATGAAMLARCAPSDKFFEFISLLYEQQQGWAYSQKPAQALLALAKQVGFTQKSFEACLTNQELLDGLSEVRNRAAEKFDVRSTPTFFINGTMVRGARTFEEFSAEIDPLL